MNWTLEQYTKSQLSSKCSRIHRTGFRSRFSFRFSWDSRPSIVLAPTQVPTQGPSKSVDHLDVPEDIGDLRLEGPGRRPVTVSQLSEELNSFPVVVHLTRHEYVNYIMPHASSLWRRFTPSIDSTNSMFAVIKVEYKAKNNNKKRQSQHLLI